MDEIYFCTDIETDGPSPGHYSMLSFATVAFKLDKTILGTFTRNLELLPQAKACERTMNWWATEPEAWKASRENPIPPKQAMEEFVEWIGNVSGKQNIQPKHWQDATEPALIFVAHPISFDYDFIKWYLYEFIGYNPFFIAGLDMASYGMAMMQTPFSKSHKAHMPKEWTNTGYEHSHVPLDDALGHAMTFCNMVAANNTN